MEGKMYNIVTFPTESSELYPVLGVMMQLASLKRPGRADNVMSLKFLEKKKIE